MPRRARAVYYDGRLWLQILALVEWAVEEPPLTQYGPLVLKDVQFEKVWQWAGGPL